VDEVGEYDWKLCTEPFAERYYRDPSMYSLGATPRALRDYWKTRRPTHRAPDHDHHHHTLQKLAAVSGKAVVLFI
jgi:hypothetical protein